MISRCLVTCLAIPSIGLSLAPHAGAQVSLSAWACHAPVIDGVLTPGEWADADRENFAITYCGESHDSTIWVKNDETYLYIAVVVQDEDYSDPAGPYDFLNLTFDNDADGVVEIGDNVWQVRYDDTLDRDGYNPTGVGGHVSYDSAVGGTDDLDAAIQHTVGVPGAIGHYTVEYRGPLDSGDAAYDFILTYGDTVGFYFTMADAEAGCAVPRWPSPWGEIVIAEPCVLDPTECPHFQDLPEGATFMVGDTFTTNGIVCTVGPFFFGPGCTNPFFGGFAEVVRDGLAGCWDKELNVNNVNIDFDFGGPTEDLELCYGEYGGEINVTINGMCRRVPNFADLPPVMGMPPVCVTAIDFGVPGTSTGVLQLIGTIFELEIGGQELWIDCGTEPEGDPVDPEFCPTFEDLALGSHYDVGDSFVTDGITCNVHEVFLGVGCIDPNAGFGATVENGGEAACTGHELEVNNVRVEFDFGGPTEDLILCYGEYGGPVNVILNGQCIVVANFADLPPSMGVPAVAITAVDAGIPGNSPGVLTLDGTIEQLEIGGQELWLDCDPQDPTEPIFRRGDVNVSGSVEIADAIQLLSHLFGLLGGGLACEDGADSNDSGVIDLADVLTILNYLFVFGSPAPPAPGPIDCGPDPTADALGCAADCP